MDCFGCVFPRCIIQFRRSIISGFDQPIRKRKGLNVMDAIVVDSVLVDPVVLGSDLVANILKGGALDDQHCPGNKGLNICYVHRAAYGSHVLALEELIKLGAAISIPVTVAATDKILQDMKSLRPRDWIQYNVRCNVYLLPPGTDALMMACLFRGQLLQTKQYMIKSIGEKACNKKLTDSVEVIRLLLSYGAHVQQRMQPYPSHWPKKLHDPLLAQCDYL